MILNLRFLALYQDEWGIMKTVYNRSYTRLLISAPLRAIALNNSYQGCQDQNPEKVLVFYLAFP